LRFPLFFQQTVRSIVYDRDIKHVVVAGTVTAVCVDSTARCAAELGFHVAILRDCTSSRTVFEQEFYCKHIFPIYANVTDHLSLLALLNE
ncbi:MAG: cysteine hydrolase, partial [Methylovulum sp.]|nr:cysteine hydrolase [Methylovulum sp.]